MPIYEYKCKSCENRFEAMRPMAQADAPAPCPECRGGETMRLLSVFAARTSSSSGGDACDSSMMRGTPCCRTIAPGGG